MKNDRAEFDRIPDDIRWAVVSRLPQPVRLVEGVIVLPGEMP